MTLLEVLGYQTKIKKNGVIKLIGDRYNKSPTVNPAGL